MILNTSELKTLAEEKSVQLYVAGLLILIPFLSPELVHAAAGEVANCTGTYNVPEVIYKAKGLFEEPVKWIQWVAIGLMPLLLAIVFFKFKSSRGRQDKIEDSMKMLYWLIGGDIALFGVMWFSSWILSKLC